MGLAGQPYHLLPWHIQRFGNFIPEPICFMDWVATQIRPEPDDALDAIVQNDTPCQQRLVDLGHLGCRTPGTIFGMNFRSDIKANNSNTQLSHNVLTFVERFGLIQPAMIDPVMVTLLGILATGLRSGQGRMAAFQTGGTTRLIDCKVAIFLPREKPFSSRMGLELFFGGKLFP